MHEEILDHCHPIWGNFSHAIICYHLVWLKFARTLIKRLRSHVLWFIQCGTKVDEDQKLISKEKWEETKIQNVHVSREFRILIGFISFQSKKQFSYFLFLFVQNQNLFQNWWQIDWNHRMNRLSMSLFVCLHTIYHSIVLSWFFSLRFLRWILQNGH